MYMHSNTYALSRINAFSELPSQAASEINTYCRYHRYATGEIIISPMDDNKDIFFVASGCVQAINILPSGSQITLQNLQNGDMFGELSAIDGAPRSSFIIALSECLIISMSAKHFNTIYQKYPCVSNALVRRLVSMVRHLCGKVLERDGCSARVRIRLDLLRRALGVERNNDSALISPPPKHKAIAANACTSRETVTRELAYLEKTGVISRQNKHFVIKDITRLTHMLTHATKPSKKY